MMRRFTLAVLVVGVLVVPGAAHGRTSDVEIGWVATPVSASQTWFRVVNTDQTNHLRLLSLHGISFDITGIKAVRAMGALAGPSCVLTTATTRFHYLDCSGDLPPNSSLILVVDTSGSGADFEIAASDSTDPSTLEYSGDAVDTTPLLPATGTFTSRGRSCLTG